MRQGCAHRTDPRRTISAWIALVCALALPAATVAAQMPERTGGWRLAEASSPYLRMHADNPVDWYPWGEEAFARARAEGKPLLISIGYFTCHWCHVMERESFRDPQIAALINRHFVPVKIDREQRPDVDAAYMRFVVATRGQGGWPMTVFATPDGHPFLGGTYYPPDERDGRPGMKQLLPRIDAFWKTDGATIARSAREVAARMQAAVDRSAPPAEITAQTPALARRQFEAEYDADDGGFGAGPKFPRPVNLLFLLADDAPTSHGIALHTLDAMATGALHDQIEGGFHRYTIDGAWRLPHFEKMLYDQALIARAYLAAHARSGEARYARIARRTLDFALAAMRDARGGFHSALAADSRTADAPDAEPEEGAYYVWSWAQWSRALPDAKLRALCAAQYGVTVAGNATEAEIPGSGLVAANVLYAATDAAALARRFAYDAKAIESRLDACRAALLDARRARPAPPVDDKVVTAWNGYMITALAQAGAQLEEPRYLEAALAAAAFLFEHSWDARSGVLYRDWRAGRVGTPGYAEDYAALAEALLALADAGVKGDWVARARRLADILLERFWDAGNHGLYGTAGDGDLWLRDKPVTDDAVPSPNSVAIGVLLALSERTGERRYAEAASNIARRSSALLGNLPSAMPYALTFWPALLAARDAPPQR